MAERRELPIEHREHARLAWMEDHVVEPIVAVNDGGRVAGRDIPRQPLDQTVHRFDLFRFRGLVLSAPAVDLAGEIVAWLAVLGKTDGLKSEAVQRRDDA